MLSAVSLALLPAVADAQETAATPDTRGAEHVVVRPGDSLWSISSDMLGPEARLSLIAVETERIYALNRGLIGGDPNLIFPGQRLLLPPTVESSAAKPTTGPAREDLGAATSGAADHASQESAARTANEGGKARDAEVNLAALPDAIMPVPAVRPLASADASHSPVMPLLRDLSSAFAPAAAAVADSLAELRADGRRLLGWGIIVLTLLVVVLMVWKLPMKRSVGAPEAWGIPSGYNDRYAYSEPPDPYGGASEASPAELLDSQEALEASSATFGHERALGGSDSEVTMAVNGSGGVGIVGVVPGRRERIRRRRRAPRPKRPPRGGVMSGTYSWEIRRALSRAPLNSRLGRSVNSRAKKMRRGPAGAVPIPSGLPRTVPRTVPRTAERVPEPLELAADAEGLSDSRISRLSARQREVLELATEGLPNAQIGRRLFITESTVKQHLHKAYRILGIRNRREAASLFGKNDQAERRSLNGVVW